MSAWEVDAAADLAAGLHDWTDAGLAALLAGLMTWKGRDREEVATVGGGTLNPKP